MLKYAVIILVVLWVISMAVGYIFWGNTKEKIKEAEQNLEDYKAKYDSTIQKGDSLESKVKILQTQGKHYLARIDSLEGAVDSLQIEHKKDIRRVANLFQPDELVGEMRATFPELKKAPIGVARVPHPKTGFMIRTFQIPVQFVASFIADHREVDNFKKQIAALGEVNFTYKTYVALQDSIIILKEQKAAAYKKGLDYGLNMYQELTKEYISTLKKPPKIGFPAVSTIITAGALGVAAGAAISK